MNKAAKNFLLKTVSQGYNDIAQSFNESRKKPMKPMVYEITRNLNILAGDKILDLGCGNGRFLQVLLELKKDLSWEYIGLDNSSKLVEIARNNYGPYFETFNLLDLSLRNELKYNYIFAWAVWHHLPGKRLRKKLLNDVYEQLQVGGYFIFSVWDLRKKENFFFLSLKSYLKQALQGQLLDWGDLLFDWKGGMNSLRYYHAFSYRELKKLVKDSSFKVEDIIQDDFNYYCILKK